MTDLKDELECEYVQAKEKVLQGRDPIFELNTETLLHFQSYL